MSAAGVLDGRAAERIAQIIARVVTRSERRGEGFCLQLCAGVRVDFAVQANFFKSWRLPFHDFPQRSAWDRVMHQE